MTQYPLAEQKLVYRVLHRHLTEFPELIDSEFLHDLQRALQKQAQAEGVYRAAYAPAPRFKLVAIGDSGHFAMLDQPAAFEAALRAFQAEYRAQAHTDYGTGLYRWPYVHSRLDLDYEWHFSALASTK